MTDARSLLASWAEKYDNDPEKPAIPAATVCVIRDTADGLETLLLRRNSKLQFAGGMWVFPGGRIDPEDYSGGDDQFAAAKTAAVREAFEESAQRIDETSLAWFAHWSPPPIAPKRFATWFFLAKSNDDVVEIDHGEIHDSAWTRPADALAQVDAREIELTPPTWVTLHDLAKFDSVAEAMQVLGGRDPRFYVTRVIGSDEGPLAVWEGDAGYETGDASSPGPRHRLLMAESGFVFEDTTMPS